MRKTIVALVLGLALSISGTALSTQSANAKTTYLPSYIRHHTWYRLTTGNEGGFHDRTTFKGNKIHIHIHAGTYDGGSYNWRFSNLKHTSTNIYYGRLHYVKGYKLVKIKIINKKHFDVTEKYTMGSRKPYGGTENYGSMIFKR